MRFPVVLIALLTLCLESSAQTRFDVTMRVDSVDRQFIVVRPSAPPPAAGYAVVFMFHGTTGDGERFYNISGWKEKGEQEGFVTVFPSSLEYCFYNDSGRPVPVTKWSNGEAEEKKCPGVVLKDDVHFIRRIVDSLLVMLPIDSRRIYASGFSNGAVFTSKLAVEMSDVFAALSASAGMLYETDSGVPARPVPFVFTMGDADRNVVDALGATIPFNDSALYVLGRSIRRYLGAFNLAEVLDTKDSTALTLTYVFNTPASSSLPSTLFSYVLLKGLDHQYPNGTNYPIRAADYLWAFFNRHILADAPDRSRISGAGLRIYPNPAADYIVIDGEGEARVTVRTILGEMVLTTTAVRGARVALDNLPGGLYIVSVSSGRQRVTQPVIVR